MDKKKFVWVGIILILLSGVILISDIALADFQPYGNINLNDVFGIFGATDINSTEFYQDGNKVLDTSGGYFNSEANLTNLLDDNYRADSWNNLTGIPHATPSNGDVTHFSLADEIYDWVIGLTYTTLFLRSRSRSLTS